ncbi:MAG: hypothetical protein RLZZ176_2658 [Cyanobacteriota bacterium]|jgi:hypothetical protein
MRGWDTQDQELFKNNSIVTQLDPIIMILLFFVVRASCPQELYKIKSSFFAVYFDFLKVGRVNFLKVHRGHLR